MTPARALGRPREPGHSPHPGMRPGRMSTWDVIAFAAWAGCRSCGGSLSGWCLMSYGCCSSGWCRRRRHGRRALAGAGTVTAALGSAIALLAAGISGGLWAGANAVAPTPQPDVYILVGAAGGPCLSAPADDARDGVQLEQQPCGKERQRWQLAAAGDGCTSRPTPAPAPACRRPGPAQAPLYSWSPAGEVLPHRAASRRPSTAATSWRTPAAASAWPSRTVRVNRERGCKPDRQRARHQCHPLRGRGAVSAADGAGQGADVRSVRDEGGRGLFLAAQLSHR